MDISGGELGNILPQQHKNTLRHRRFNVIGGPSSTYGWRADAADCMNAQLVPIAQAATTKG